MEWDFDGVHQILSVIFYFLSWVISTVCYIMIYTPEFHNKNNQQRTQIIYIYFKILCTFSQIVYNLNSAPFFLAPYYLIKYFFKSNSICWIKWIYHIYLIQWPLIDMFSDDTTKINLKKRNLKKYWTFSITNLEPSYWSKP